MPFEYEKDPYVIEKNSFEQIRQLTTLDGLSQNQQQVAMRVVHTTGLPDIVERLRFSSLACEKGIEALKNNCNILCDVEMVKQGLTKRMLFKEPLCFLNNTETITHAKISGETRTMAALQQWKNNLTNSVVVIGNAPTALFRLMEMLESGVDRPALIIAMPVGFIGAEQSKQTLWEIHKSLGVECITLLGKQGGSAVASASCNALLRCLRGEFY